MMENRNLSWQFWIASLLIAAVVIGLYWNTLNNEFLTYDDDRYIYENPLVTGEKGLAAIWMNEWPDGKLKVQYQPLVLTSFWLEYQLVGVPESNEEYIDQPAHPLYHITQFALHALNACLLLLLLLNLGIRYWPSIATALVFAMHPINVASVAWVTERKNTLSALFILLALLLYVGYRRSRGPIRWWRYVLVLLCFVLAMFAKTASMFLVLLLPITDFVIDRRITWSSILRALPMGIISIIMVQSTLETEVMLAKAHNVVPIFLRPIIACASLVHYVLTMIFPFYQPFIYPRWAVSASANNFIESVVRYSVSVVIVLAACWLIWRFRDKLGHFWLWGLAFFVLSAVPYLGLHHFNFMNLSFVSDHFMYLGSAGVALMIALLLDAWQSNGEGQWKKAIAIGLIVVFVGWFSVRTVQQNKIWENNKTLWTHTLELNPNCLLAAINLGNLYSRKGDNERSLYYYKIAVEIDPELARAHHLAAHMAYELGQVNEALRYYKSGAEAADRNYPNQYTLRILYAQLLHEQGFSQEALKQYQIVLGRKIPEDVHSRVQKAVSKIEAELHSRQNSNL
jgi:tetratricopeptide (TPR) repeat protein